MEASPEAAQELHRLGLRLVPVLKRGDRIFHGWNPEGLARFLGVEPAPSRPIPPQELARRLDRILQVALNTVRPCRPEHLAKTLPGRARTLRELAYHIFRLSLAYRDALEEGYFPENWLLEKPPAEVSGGPELARYGETVRRRLAAWFEQPDAFSGSVETYYGRQTAHQLLLRTTWHAAQHLREFYGVLTRVGACPDEPLPEAELEGLPLPKALW